MKETYLQNVSELKVSLLTFFVLYCKAWIFPLSIFLLAFPKN